ncbi:MAG: hypothetical protein JO269_04130 [Burkholderiaceae bacterium]|nr:hypothetical protein [Burkholderiaceae bacterium]
MIRRLLRHHHSRGKTFHAAALAALLCSGAIDAHAAGGPKPNLGVTLGPAILCRDKLDLKFYYDYLAASFGPPYKRDQGAYWFKAKAQLYGQPVQEVFVGDQTGDWIFVGVLFKGKPDDLAKALKTSTGMIYVKTDSGYQYSPYQSQGTSEIMYQNTDAKVFCRKFVGEVQQ